MKGRQQWERVSLGKAHSEAVRGSERKVGEAYRSGMEGSEERAREAARTDGDSVYYIPPIERGVRRTVRAERMELVRELDGEKAYEKMRWAVGRASQPPPPPRMFRRAVGRSGTLAPAAERFSRPPQGLVASQNRRTWERSLSSRETTWRGKSMGKPCSFVVGLIPDQ